MAIFASSSYIILFATFSTFYFHGDGPVTLALLLETLSIFVIVRSETMTFFSQGMQYLFQAYAGSKRIQVIFLIIVFLLSREYSYSFLKGVAADLS